MVKATLNVQSMPSGAQIFVDGTRKGKAPLKLELPLGKHEVTLRLKNYHDWEAQFQLKEEGKDMPLKVRLIHIEEKIP